MRIIPCAAGSMCHKALGEANLRCGHLGDEMSDPVWLVDPGIAGQGDRVTDAGLGQGEQASIQ